MLIKAVGHQGYILGCEATVRRILPHLGRALINSLNQAPLFATVLTPPHILYLSHRFCRKRPPLWILPAYLKMMTKIFRYTPSRRQKYSSPHHHLVHPHQSPIVQQGYKRALSLLRSLLTLFRVRKKAPISSCSLPHLHHLQRGLIGHQACSRQLHHHQSRLLCPPP